MESLDLELVKLLDTALEDREDCEVCLQAGREPEAGAWYLISTCPDDKGREILLVCDRCRVIILSIPLAASVLCVPCGDGHPKYELKVAFERRN